jgi:hypothetical protein
MADLHKFLDDVRSAEGRAAPIGARHLDENFNIVKLKVSSALSGFIYIKENYPQPNELDFVVPPPSGDSVPMFSGGVFSQWITVRSCDDESA